MGSSKNNPLETTKNKAIKKALLLERAFFISAQPMN